MRYEFNRIRERDSENARLRRSTEHRIIVANSFIMPGNVTPRAMQDLKDVIFYYMTPKFAMEIMFKEVKAQNAADFIVRDDSPAQAFPAGNAIQYLDFLEYRNYAVRRGSDAHLAITQVLVAVNESAQRVLSAAEAQSVQLRTILADSFWKYPIQ